MEWVLVVTAGCCSSAVDDTEDASLEELDAARDGDSGGSPRDASAPDAGLDASVPARWRPTSLANAASPRVFEEAVWTGSGMLVWGGVVCAPGGCAVDGEFWADDGSFYDPGVDAWYAISAVGGPMGHVAPAVAWAGDRLFIWSGSPGQAEKGGPQLPPLDSGAVYSIDTDSWVPVPTDDAPSPRMHAHAVWTGREVIVWGGGTRDGVGRWIALNDGGRFDPATEQWHAMEPLVIAEDEDAMPPFVLWTGSTMIVWDGSRDEPPRPGWAYDPDADAWSEISAQSADVAGSCGAVWTGDGLLAFGPDSYSRYDPVADEWAVSPSAITLCATPVWSGRDVLLWQPGGFRPGANAIFDPSDESVSEIEAEGAPTARTGFHVFWTGDEMLVWGGTDSATLERTNTGGLYRPPR